MRTLFIEPGSPWENGYIESFNGKLRDELLDGEIFDTLREAQVLVARWRKHYSTARPHSSLDYRPPAPEAAQLQAHHGGGDYLVVQDFIRAVVNGTPPPIGIHEAMDMTLPGLISQQSIAQGGVWLAGHARGADRQVAPQNQRTEERPWPPPDCLPSSCCSGRQ